MKQVYMLFLQNCLTIFEEAIKSLEKDELTAPELFDIMYRLRQKLILRKNDSVFGNKTASELKIKKIKKKKNVTRKGQPSYKLHRTFLISLLEL